MSWHIVTQVGKEDHFFPKIPDSDGRLRAVFERTDDRWYVGNDAVSRITDVFHHNVRSEAEDLLYLALSVYTADLRIPRSKTKDRWTRDIRLYVPVFNEALWQKNEELVTRTLAFLTGDTWSIRFRARGEQVQWEEKFEDEVPKPEKVCLFSGGLDSLVGAIEILAEGTHVALAGHHGAGVANAFQSQTLDILQRRYEGQITPFMFYAQPPKRKITEGEPSMRSRSFLFFAMGVAVASAIGDGTPLVIAENGFISLNVPLTPSRAGSASTRTTHPHYTKLFSEMISAVRLNVPLHLPYRFKTKGEMIAQCGKKSPDVLTETTPLTMSCSHAEAGRFRGFSPKEHCGYCVPCIIRRAATDFAGISDADYGIDVRIETPDYWTNSGRDARAFEMAINRDAAMNINRAVFKILGPGPLPAVDIKQYGEMYLRGLAEVRRFLTTPAK
jgi:hypothetical protein